MRQTAYKFTTDDWTSEEIHRAITEPTGADKVKWQETDWGPVGNSLPHIWQPEADWRASQVKHRALSIFLSGEEARRFYEGHDPEAVAYYEQHFGGRVA